MSSTTPNDSNGTEITPVSVSVYDPKACTLMPPNGAKKILLHSCCAPCSGTRVIRVIRVIRAIRVTRVSMYSIAS